MKRWLFAFILFLAAKGWGAVAFNNQKRNDQHFGGFSGISFPIRDGGRIKSSSVCFDFLRRGDGGVSGDDLSGQLRWIYDDFGRKSQRISLLGNIIMSRKCFI